MNTDPDPAAQERAQLKKKTTIVSIVLIAMGAFVLLFLKPVSFPVRVAVGLADIVIGIALLLFLRPKFNR